MVSFVQCTKHTTCSAKLQGAEKRRGEWEGGGGILHSETPISSLLAGALRWRGRVGDLVAELVVSSKEQSIQYVVDLTHFPSSAFQPTLRRTRSCCGTVRGTVRDVVVAVGGGSDHGALFLELQNGLVSLR